MPKNKETLPEKQARLKAAALLNAETFYHYKLIAMSTGIDQDTLKTYREEDKEFSEQLEQVRASFIGKKMRAARPEFILERLNPELFKERKENEITGDKLKPLMVQFLDGNSTDT